MRHRASSKLKPPIKHDEQDVRDMFRDARSSGLGHGSVKITLPPIAPPRKIPPPKKRPPGWID